MSERVSEYPVNKQAAPEIVPAIASLVPCHQLLSFFGGGEDVAFVGVDDVWLMVITNCCKFLYHHLRAWCD